MTTRGQEWSDQDKATLRALWMDDTVTTADIAAAVQRHATKRAVLLTAKRMGLPPRRRPGSVEHPWFTPWSDADSALLKEMWYDPDYTLLQIAKAMTSTRAESSISRRAKVMKLPNRRVLFQGRGANKRRAARLASGTPVPQAVLRGCAFPLALVPRVKMCGKLSNDQFCETHAKLMEST